MIRPLVTSLVYLDGVQREFYHHDADLCDPTQISDMFQFIKSRYTRGPDILVNNAGTFRPHIFIGYECNMQKNFTAHLLLPLLPYHYTCSLVSIGMQYVEPIEKMPVEKWDQVLAVNLSASFHTIRLALPGMRERGLSLEILHFLVSKLFVMYTTLRSCML